jgi:putative Mg2+ transporter-C (MgtC) family protein
MLPQDEIIRIVFSVFLATLIGYERERLHKPAGLRTHILVCMASTLLTIVAMDQFPGEVARIAAGIVTGIGFLGAGSIISSKEGTHGLTTAASIWMMCIIGITTGVGMYIIAVLTTVLTYIVLRFGVLEREMERQKKL